MCLYLSLDLFSVLSRRTSILTAPSIFRVALLPARRQQKAAKGSNDAVDGGRAFGELNYLKPAQEQASFMSGSTQCRLCASRIHVLRARVHVRAAVASPGMNVLIMKVNLFRVESLIKVFCNKATSTPQSQPRPPPPPPPRDLSVDDAFLSTLRSPYIIYGVV